MPRVGLTAQAVTRAASSLVDREGPDALTITRVADDLGVRPPSLYNHIAGLDGLERLVALDGIDLLADVCRTAVMGRSRGAALRSLAHAYRAFATAHPGVYLLLQKARPADMEYGARTARLLEPVLALLSGYGLGVTDRVHAARTLRSALHGFVILEQQSGFGLDVDVDDSFEWLLDALERGVTAPTPGDHTSGDPPRAAEDGSGTCR